MMNQIIEGTTKANGTPNNRGYAHVEPSQAPSSKNNCKMMMQFLPT
jgi:hypothetical protein